jgi:serine/threonine protein kinase
MIKRAPREPANDPVRELAMNEIRVLQLCSKSKLVVELEDYFEEDDSIYTVH